VPEAVVAQSRFRVRPLSLEPDRAEGRIAGRVGRLGFGASRQRHRRAVVIRRPPPQRPDLAPDMVARRPGQAARFVEQLPRRAQMVAHHPVHPAALRPRQRPERPGLDMPLHRPVPDDGAIRAGLLHWGASGFVKYLIAMRCAIRLCLSAGQSQLPIFQNYF